MEVIYTHRIKKNTISANKDLPTKEGDYIYFIRLVPVFGGKPRYKIGTTNRPLQRLKEHLKSYHYEFNIQCFGFHLDIVLLKQQQELSAEWFNSGQNF